ncbi:hypothetical protein SAMN04515695_0905 [Pseudovibrio sp. Tun.PSC04-5.I4]|nr:hypothetical protein SAMN04515695_0129 [Pseudovibrio sp. Tun.PSC04-5.I4]SDQ33476.1 hypothetical protein SAMN04515695_0905 [Pseudovibrio sp. Tun.PSC04-5.I4]
MFFVMTMPAAHLNYTSEILKSDFGITEIINLSNSEEGLSKKRLERPARFSVILPLEQNSRLQLG